MNKTSLGIIPHATALHRHGALVYLIDVGAGKLDIDSLPFHMQAMACDSATAASQPSIGSGGTISGNHLVHAFAPHFPLDSPEDIQKLRVNDMNLSGLVIAEKLVDLGQGFAVVCIPRGISESQFFLGTGVKKRKRAFF